MLAPIRIFSLRILKRNFSTCPILMEKMDQKKFLERRELKRIRDSDIATKELFEDSKAKNKEAFMGALEIFKNRDTRRRGSVEFIRSALKHMEVFGVEKDLEAYKSLIDTMPKNVYVPRNMIQAGFFHYPRQQDCLVEVLQKMADNKVTPDSETGDLIISITGMDSGPWK